MDFRKTYNEFPRTFWVVVFTSFIDGIGGTLLFPFFALYVTQRFGVGMTQAGIVLGLFSIFGLFGSMLGGALTDRFGRRKLILFGLVFSALSALSLGLVNEFAMLIPLAVVVGSLQNIAGPAHGAMIADILPERQRSEGFGILRVVGNLAWIIGPTIGGFVAGYSYFALFVIDAVISCLVAVLFYLYVPETKRQVQVPAHAGAPRESLVATFKGYRLVLRDYAFVAFMGAAMLMSIAYQQLYNSLSVYLRNVHGVAPQGYGVLLTTSAVTVILLQFTISRWVKGRPPFLMLALGTLFYMVGFGMYGVVATFPLFMAAVVVITFGEMVVVPTIQVLVARFAPEALRGRYMAVFGMTYGIPAIIGPSLAGLIIDGSNPNLLWYVGAGLCLLAALAYCGLHWYMTERRPFTAPAVAPAATETASA